MLPSCVKGEKVKKNGFSWEIASLSLWWKILRSVIPNFLKLFGSEWHQKACAHEWESHRTKLEACYGWGWVCQLLIATPLSRRAKPMGTTENTNPFTKSGCITFLRDSLLLPLQPFRPTERIAGNSCLCKECVGTIWKQYEAPHCPVMTHVMNLEKSCWFYSSENMSLNQQYSKNFFFKSPQTHFKYTHTQKLKPDLNC